MLPKKHRLNKQQDIVAIIRHGEVVKAPFINIHYRLLASNQTTRVACIVSKKVHRSAVKRHTYQRWLRVCAGRQLDQLGSRYDMVWVARPPITQFSKWADLCDRLTPQLKQLS